MDTRQTRAGVTGADGSYRFPALAVGSYEIHVEQAGFRAEVRRGLTLPVVQEAVVNFTLRVGNIEQTVAVTAETPLVNTTSGSLGGLVDEQQPAAGAVFGAPGPGRRQNGPMQAVWKPSVLQPHFRA